ncbi:MAG TPA: VC0807 family protein [Pseudonocardia sp.]
MITSGNRRGHPGLQTLLVDLAASLALYYGLRAVGVDDLTALALGAAPPAITAVVSVARGRRVEPVALAVLVVMTVAQVASLITGDPRELLVRNALLSLPSGLWMLATLWARRPLTFRVTQTLFPHRAALMDELWDDDPRFRRAWWWITVTWGGVLLLDCLLRVLMAATLPVPAVPALDTALTFVTLVVMQIPTNVFLYRSGSWHLLFGRRRAPSTKESVR